MVTPQRVTPRKRCDCFCCCCCLRAHTPTYLRADRSSSTTTVEHQQATAGQRGDKHTDIHTDTPALPGWLAGCRFGSLRVAALPTASTSTAVTNNINSPREPRCNACSAYQAVNEEADKLAPLTKAKKLKEKLLNIYVTLHTTTAVCMIRPLRCVHTVPSFVAVYLNHGHMVHAHYYS